MMRLIIWILIIYVAYLVIKNMRGKQVVKEDPRPRGEATFRDPVCGVFVGEEDAVIGRYKDERIYFCSRECLEKYQQQLAEKLEA